MRDRVPLRGYKSLTVAEAFFKEIASIVEKANAEAGYRKYRSLPQFLEELVAKYGGEPRLEHFNMDARGIKVLDRKLGRNGMIVDVFFKQDKVCCEYCESSDCEHTRFALSLPKVQELIKKKGWKLK